MRSRKDSRGCVGGVVERRVLRGGRELALELVAGAGRGDPRGGGVGGGAVAGGLLETGGGVVESGRADESAERAETVGFAGDAVEIAGGDGLGEDLFVRFEFGDIALAGGVGRQGGGAAEEFERGGVDDVTVGAGVGRGRELARVGGVLCGCDGEADAGDVVGFEEKTVHAGLAAALPHFFAVVGGGGEDEGAWRGGAGAKGAGDVAAFAVGKFPIEEHDGVVALGEAAQRFLGGFGGVGDAAEFPSDALEDGAVVGFVFDDEERAVDGGCCGGLAGSVGLFELGAGEQELEREGGTVAGRAFDADAAIDHFGEHGAGGEAEAGAGSLAGAGAAAADEFLENQFLLVGRNAGPVIDDVEVEIDHAIAFASGFDANFDGGARGVFEGVGDEVDEDRLDLVAIALEAVAESGGPDELKGAAGLVGLGGEQGEDFVEQRAEGERAALEVAVAVFEFRELKDVFEDLGERGGDGFEGAGELAFARVEAVLVEHREQAGEAVERVADLVADVVEEFAFGGAREFDLAGACGDEAVEVFVLAAKT